jgi:hypothetical protein
MGNSVARNVLLFALGAVTKFGLGYDLRIDNSTPALLVVGDK